MTGHRSKPMRKSMKHGTHQVIRCAVEAMERRTLLSAVLGADGTLTLTGTSNPDNFHVSAGATQSATGVVFAFVFVNQNSQISQFDAKDVKRIRLNALGGDDTILVDSVGGGRSFGTTANLIRIAIDGGDGNDTITDN